MSDLLIELFSEEIPARMQAKAADDLKKLVTDGLVEAGLTYSSAAAFATPRRLALSVEGLTAESRAVREERKGPATTAPEAAVQGFLRSTGLTMDQLVVRDDKKGQVYFAVIEKPGRKAPAIIAEVLESAIRNFPWPKSMRWGSGNLRWVRPLHSIICILTTDAGAEVVSMDVDGIVAGNTTRGHRFMGHGDFSVTSFDDYEAKLKRHKVYLRADDRAAAIWHDATNMAFASGLEVVEDKGLLAEVSGLVEWPVVLMGPIGEQFLNLPPEVLQTSMREHQKFFSLRNPRTGRIERFITVANMETTDNGATIIAGNGKVLTARLSDAKFFYDNDLRVAKAGMGEWLDGLKSVTFHNKLGSQFDRVERIAALAREIAPMVGADPALAEQAARVAKADLRSQMVGEFPELQGLMGRYYATAAGMPAEVAAASEDHYSPLGPTGDVPTAPVSVAVALADKIDTLTGFWAIDEKPTGSKDPFALRRAALGVIRLVLGNGTRLRLLTNFFAAMQSVYHQFDYATLRREFEVIFSESSPQAEDVPIFAERLLQWASRNSLESVLLSRVDYQAFQKLIEQGSTNYSSKDFNEFVRSLGVFVRTILNIRIREEEKELFTDDPLDEIELEHYEVAKEYTANVATLNSFDLLSFFHDRLKVFLKDQGIPHDVIDACLAMPGNDDLTLLVKRAEALAAFLKTDDGTNLLQGFKRANNIVTQAEEKDGVEYSYGADVKYAEYPEEVALFAALDMAEAAIKPLMDGEDFVGAMTAMATLRQPIDAFFTVAQVNSDKQVIRRNRLNLLNRIREICMSVADLTKVES